MKTTEQILDKSDKDQSGLIYYSHAIAAMEEYAAQQVVLERERIRDTYVNGLPTGECKAWDYVLHAKRFVEQLDSLQNTKQ